jgi:hypothetical protein
MQGGAQEVLFDGVKKLELMIVGREAGPVLDGFTGGRNPILNNSTGQRDELVLRR